MIVLDVVLIAVNAPHPANVLASAAVAVTPLGVAYLGAALEQEGRRVALIDMNQPPCPSDWVVRFAAANRPRLIGLSCATESYGNAVRLARRLRAAVPEAVLVAGGPHVTFLPEQALAAGVFDAVALREGERTAVELADAVCAAAAPPPAGPARARRLAAALSPVAGLAYFDPAAGRVARTPARPLQLDLDSLPFPARHLFLPRRRRAQAAVLTGRGCPGACAFCAATAMAGGRRRARSPENVLAELLRLRAAGAAAVFFVDDTLTADPPRLSRLLDLLEEHRPGLTWVCESRADGVAPDLLARMAALGCVSVQFGVESGSQELLDAMGKGVDLGEIEQAVAWSAAAGLQPVCSFIIGQPWETAASLAASLEFAAGLQRRYLARCAFALLAPFPGTRLWRRAARLGLRREVDDFDQYNMHTPICATRHFSLAQLRNLHFETVRRLALEAGEELAAMLAAAGPGVVAGAPSPWDDWY